MSAFVPIFLFLQIKQTITNFTAETADTLQWAENLLKVSGKTIKSPGIPQTIINPRNWRINSSTRKALHDVMMWTTDNKNHKTMAV